MRDTRACEILLRTPISALRCTTTMKDMRACKTWLLAFISALKLHTDERHASLQNMTVDSYISVEMNKHYEGQDRTGQDRTGQDRAVRTDRLTDRPTDRPTLVSLPGFCFSVEIEKLSVKIVLFISTLKRGNNRKWSNIFPR